MKSPRPSPKKKNYKTPIQSPNRSQINFTSPEQSVDNDKEKENNKKIIKEKFEMIYKAINNYDEIEKIKKYLNREITCNQVLIRKKKDIADLELEICNIKKKLGIKHEYIIVEFCRL